MELMPMIIALVVLGVVLWAIQTYLPVDARIKNLIMIIAVAFVVIWFLQSMGWIGSVRGGANTVSIR